jgi:haloalkane dehalogenase
MTVLRTPDSAFDDLPDYPFAPNYLEIQDDRLGSLRMHYLDEGPKDGPVVLCMHGEPTWSFLYRKMIPVLVNAGCRVLVPDLIGFGKSDKPDSLDDFTYAGHVGWMLRWLEELDIQGITLVCQDWGGLIGLRLVTAMPDKFARVTVSNTGLPIGDRTPSDGFLAWRKLSQESPDFPVGKFVAGGCSTKLSQAEIAAYDAPYPDDRYKAAARKFPVLVPIDSEDPGGIDNKAAWKVLSAFDKPFLTCFTDGDPITAGGDVPFQKLVAGAKNQPHRTLKGGRHFVQEDCGVEWAETIAAWMSSGN